MIPDKPIARAEAICRYCDGLVSAGILGLIGFTPLAFGAVYPWAFCVMEAVIFLLVALWMVKLVLGGHALSLPSAGVLPALFVAMVGFQLVPLPPAVVRALSPATYALHVKTLCGWPGDVNLADSPDDGSERGQRLAVLPTIEEVRQGAPVPFAHGIIGGGAIERNLLDGTGLNTGLNKGSAGAAACKRVIATRGHNRSSWRPLSIAPSLTRTALLKLLAYAGLFLLIAKYPFDRCRTGDAERRFCRLVVVALLSTAMVVAVVALVQCSWWNGKIFGFLVPYDWGTARPEIRHAGGPFVNPDHLANYLAMVLPLAIAGALWRNSIIPSTRQIVFRLLCSCGVGVIWSALLLSLSRAGWIGALSGLLVLVWIMRFRLGKDYAVVFQRRKAPALLASVAGLVAVTIVALLLIGSAGRNRVDNRLEETLVRETGLGERVVLWEDSLGMVRDFPVLGVGLGCWSELFPHYHRPPWRSGRFLEAHNDYLQLVAETGFVGFALLAWFFFHAAFRLFARSRTIAPAARTTFAALVSGLAVMAVHEFFDFNLQIPANAFLFTLMLGLANRLAPAPDAKKLEVFSLRGPRVAAAGMGLLALILALVALGQEKVPYPYNIRRPASLEEARNLLLAHPASSFAHLALADCCGNAAPDTDRLKQLEIALWLDPSNPFARDAYAGVLLREKRIPEGLKELTTSVFVSPSIYTHSYLAQRVIPWLSADEQAAIEQGLKRARALGYAGALEGLANIYASLGRIEELAKLYQDEASKQPDGEARARYLLEAGQAYAQGRRPGRAEMLFRLAALAAPSDPRPYHYLAVSIFAPQNDLGSAQAVINQGIDNGADPFVLSLSLAEAAEKVGDLKSAEGALGRAVTLRPASFQTRMRLGLLYLSEGKFDRAALVIRKATDINPLSGNAFFNLGRAEEGGYQYFAAGKAYARALELEPGNAVFQEHYREFRRKLRNDTGA